MDVDKLKEILAALDGSKVTLIDWTDGQERLKLQLGYPPVAAPLVAAAAPSGHAPSPLPAPVLSPPPPVAPPKVAAKAGFTVNSPFVGTFYRSPSPESPSFVEVGSVVQKGQVLCIVEAMKLMNEIEAEQPGRVAEVLVPNGAPVEYGEPLFRLEPQ